MLWNELNDFELGWRLATEKSKLNVTAYYMNYKNNRKKYIENFFKLINWKKVEENFENAIEK